MTINVDPQEITKFSLLASTWWDPEGSSKPLHKLNPLRLKFIIENCELQHQTVLDVGCGGGILSESLARAGATVTGIDMSLETLTVARLHAKTQALILDYQQITVEALAAQQPHSFDIITCMELLEHVPDPLAIIKACSQLIKPQGKLFFSTLNRNLKSYLTAIIGAEYLLKALPRGTHAYAKFIKPSELANWARSNQLSLAALQGISINPLTQKYYLTTDVSVNYLAYCEKIS